ncbi:MAG: hypothetical protein JNL08_14990 [Planctomycetes bacterium]|nr:hypothetical protein [Planctomycetota bacterium]
MAAAVPAERPTAAESWRRGDAWVLLAITAVAFALRLQGVRDWSLSPSEVATWQAVTMPLDGEHGFFASPFAAHPLALLALRALLDHGVLPFVGEGWLRLPAVFAGTLTVPLFALAARHVLARGAVLLAAALLALHPWHIGASQAFAPPVFAVGGVVLALLAAMAGRGWPARTAAVLLAAAACATDRSGCLVVPMLLGAVAATRWQAAVGRARWLALALGAAAVLLPLALQLGFGVPFDAGGDPGLAGAAARQFGPSVWGPALLAAWLVRPAPVALVAAAWAPLAGLALVAGTGHSVAAEDGLAALPLLLALAAAAVHAVAVRVRATGPGLATALGATAVPAALLVALAVGAALRGTVYGGDRSPWRAAADAVLRAKQAGRDLVVTAGEGRASLQFYLRPNEWRGAATDPHPGLRVAALGDGAPTADDGAAVQVLVLRSAEWERLVAPAGAADALRQAWELQRVLPCPREFGDGSVYLLRRRGG